jgi:hypothetical protein
LVAKKIVLITTGQPSVNPRIIKEADVFHAAGYEVMLFYCFFINWASEKDKVLLEKVPWKYKIIGGSPHGKKMQYFFTRLRNRVCSLFSRFVGPSFFLFERVQARAYDELLQEAKKIKADWYIGHNLGALAVAVKAARFHGAKAGFDFEDYYRGENTPVEIKTFRRISYLENKYLPFLSYFSTASELITEAVKKDHPGFKGVVIILNNCFPLKQQPLFKEKKSGDKTLQLCWFSQTIGINRGLEVLIQALLQLNDPDIHLTLAGRCDEAMLAYVKKHAGVMISNIHFAGIIQPELLPSFVSKFDVGLALETGFSENNNIALSNKIFTYLLAGNAIILSETTMQLAFNKSYHVGESFAMNDKSALAQKIKLYKDTNKLNKQKMYNFKLSTEQQHWELESEKLIAVIKNLAN